MVDVYIVRHGNTFDPGDIVRRVGARTDLPLSRSGCKQADALATHFQRLHPQGFRAGFCSTLMRTRQTAETIIDAFDRKPHLQVLQFLCEVDYGPDENMPEADVVARIGADALDLWDTQGVVPPGWKVDPADLIDQWSAFFSGQKAADHNGEPILVVTSNGIARFVLQAADTSRLDSVSIKLKTGAYGVVSLCEGPGPVVTRWGIRPPDSV
ncbi:MAG: histidine phosphatase family protein [Pseudomonadota bacterium]